MDLPAGIKIRENSMIAWLASKKLKTRNVAIVLGKTIHLSGVGRNDFLSNEAWVKHELKHVEQFREYGFFHFIILYIMESIRSGYYHNRFESEARQAEKK